MKNFATPMNGLDTSPIRKAFELAASIKDPINLSIGQPHFPCPKNIIEALNKAAENGKTSYTLTAGIPELREALAEKYKTQNKIEYAISNRILVTSGISSALLLLFTAIVNKDDECLIITPYFLMYPSMLKFHGAKLHFINENFTEDDIKKLNFNNLKLIIYSNPSNPTGYIFSRKQLELLVGVAEKYDSYLISDEIYELFDYDKEFISVGSFYDKAITLSGFSKTYNMTGLRLASILAEEEVIKALTTLQQYSIVCAPSNVQYAGLEALKTDMSFYIQDYKEKRDFVYESLKDYYPIQKSKGAFYYFLPIKGNDEEFVKKAVLEKKLITVPGFIFNDSHSYIRISFASEKLNLERGVEALKQLA